MDLEVAGFGKGVCIGKLDSTPKVVEGAREKGLNAYGRTTLRSRKWLNDIFKVTFN